MRNRLSDSDNMSALASRGATGTAAYVRVHWGQQHADWKSMDTMDGTEITFEALLHDVARYWGVPADECALCHGDGAVWPLEAYVASEMRSVATPEARPLPSNARTHARTHARMHARTHARTHARAPRGRYEEEKANKAADNMQGFSRLSSMVSVFGDNDGAKGVYSLMDRHTSQTDLLSPTALRGDNVGR